MSGATWALDAEQDAVSRIGRTCGDNHFSIGYIGVPMPACRRCCSQCQGVPPKGFACTSCGTGSAARDMEYSLLVIEVPA